MALTDAFVTAYTDALPSVTVDVMKVWGEKLPEFDNAAIDAKYKGVAGSAMNEAETSVWNRIQTLVARFKRADRIVLGVPMWNFAYPYKLKQLIDLVSQRNMLFTYDGERFGPLLQTPRAMVIYTRGQEYKEDLPAPPSGSTTNQAMSSSGSISSVCKRCEHWRLRTLGAIKPKPACEQRERRWQLSPKISDLQRRPRGVEHAEVFLPGAISERVLGLEGFRGALPMMTQGAMVFPVVTRCMIEPSAMRRCSVP